jgi:hypothetical protein
MCPGGKRLGRRLGVAWQIVFGFDGAAKAAGVALADGGLRGDGGAGDVYFLSRAT